nr:putative UPF0481 protein At3g02645 [Tanacetum cinerariifolium]
MKKNDEARIRASYHKLIDMSGDALIWMMAVDMAFFLNSFKCKKLSHVTILRDLVMMENQIPLFLIKTMLEHQCKRNTELNKSAEEIPKTMLMGLYHELSPFQEIALPDVDINDCEYLLDFLYHLIVPNNKELGIIETEIDVKHDAIIEVKDDKEKEDTFAKKSDLKRFMKFVTKILSKSNARLVSILRKVIMGKPMALVLKLPWKIISNIPILKVIKEPIERMLEKLQGEEEETTEDESDQSKAPRIEEITIPSVTEMAQAGIKMSPVNGGMVVRSARLYDVIMIIIRGRSPRITRSEGSAPGSRVQGAAAPDRVQGAEPLAGVELIRELIMNAYEACVAAGPLVVARYTELMNGKIDTEEDATFLRERGIVVNQQKSDQEVADLWNGMSKSVKLTKAPKMDKVIEDVNVGIL